MSLLGRIFGTEKAIEAATKAVDAVVFTPEEKANHFKEMLKLYEPFKLAQRLIALVFCPVYVLAWVVVFALYMTGVEVSDKAIEMLNGDMGNVVMLIVAFYFGGGMLNTLRK